MRRPKNAAPGERVRRPAASLALGLLLAAGPVAAGDLAPPANCNPPHQGLVTVLTTAFERMHGVSLHPDTGRPGNCRPAATDPGTAHGVRLNPIAWEPLAVITHPDNPVRDISLTQLRAVYDGQITNWRLLGGPDRPLELQVRANTTSGVGRALRERLFDDPEHDFVAAAVHRTSDALEAAVETNPNALAVTGAGTARLRRVRQLSLAGRAANDTNLRSGAYPLYRRLYIADDPADPQRAAVRELIEFAHSPEGRRILRRQGAIPYLDALSLAYGRTPTTGRAAEPPGQ